MGTINDYTPEQSKLITEAMRLLGQRTTRKKAKAARINGKKGGRPKRKPTVSISDAKSKEIALTPENKV